MRKAPRKRRHHPVFWAVFILFDIVVVIGIALFLAGAMLAGKDIPAPDWVADRAGARLTEGLGGGRAEVGAITLQVEPRQLPKVAFRDVRLSTAGGSDLLTVPVLGISLDKAALWRGRVQPRSFTVEGAVVRLRRDAAGNFDLGFSGGAGPASLGSLGEAVRTLESVFDLPLLAPVETIEMHQLALLFEDERAGRSWNVERGDLVLENSASALSISVDAALAEAAEAAGAPTLALRLSLDRTTGATELSTLVKDVPAPDIGAQAPALSWLRPLDARVSGAMIAILKPDGSLGALNGTLGIGAGAFRPERRVRAIPFDGARAYFRYDPEQTRVIFDELSLSAPDLTVEAAGHGDLIGPDKGWPESIIGQLRFSDVRFEHSAMLPRPARFDGGMLDVKLSLDPFRARIGQAILTAAPEAGDKAPPTTIRAEGEVFTDADGWQVDVDVGVETIGVGPLMSLWPFQLAPGTRDWVGGHVLSGAIRNARAGLRLGQGRKPEVGLSFEFEDAEARPLATLPPIAGAAGYASVGGNQFALALDAGGIVPPEGGEIDLAGGGFRVADTRRRPGMAEVLLRASSSVTAALSLLDQPPFEFLSKAQQPVTLAEGRAEASGSIGFPIMPGLTAAEVRYDVAGTARDVSSEKAVPGRRLAADRLSFRADNDALTIEGDAALDEVPLSGTFTLPFGADAPPLSVEGTVEIGRRFVDRFGIGLPEDMVTGAGRGSFRLSLPQGAAPAFSLTSGLNGVGLALSSLGWSKPAGASGKLAVSGRLGSPPVVDSLEVTAPGLNARGSVTLAPDGGLDRAQFARVALDGWIDAPVTLRGRGAGRTPSVSVDGGWIDIRKIDLGDGSGGGGDSAPLSLALDRLTVTEGLELNRFRGDMTMGDALTGRFTARVNGSAAVSGSVEPGRRGGTAVKIESNDAGAAMKAAGIFSRASGGSLSLDLQPRNETGEYDGALKVRNVRVNSASALAALLNAISLVGLIDELNGAGVVFSAVDAAFRLTPSYVRVRDASAVGPSLGISVDGIYDMVNDRMDFQGVLSPIYMVNSIGSLFTRRGEGLFGFNYRMRGSSGNPVVDVNPLSVLTPGKFREIFRAAPPRNR